MKIGKRIAIGGIFSSLSIIAMFLSGIFPFAEYTCPAVAGILLIPIVFEINKTTSYIAYIVVSVLSLLITPNKEAVALFIGFLGYYPILKSNLEQLKSRFLEWFLKILIFNITVISTYLILIYVLSNPEILSEFNNTFKYGALIFLLIANVVFVVYDFALTRIAFMYDNVIRPKIKRIKF